MDSKRHKTRNIHHKNCIRCRYLHKLKVEQKMASLPVEIQLQCPPFTNIGVDLCGPLVVHAMTNKRATMKVWNVIFVCLNTKAVSMHLAPGYATYDFMLAYDSHIYDRGLPNQVHSDKGSQLVAAGKEVVEFEWDRITKEAAARGTTWNFAPAGGQWRNGKTRMNYAEFSPHEDFLVPITPNMLLTGHSSNRLPEDRLSSMSWSGPGGTNTKCSSSPVSFLLKNG